MPPPIVRGPTPGRSPAPLPLSLASLDERVVSLEEKSFYDNITMAALKEDLDAEANKAMLKRRDGRGHVGEGCFELTLQGLLLCAEGLQVAVENAGHAVDDLEHFVHQRLKTIGLAVVGAHGLLPRNPVEIVLAAQVPDQL